MRSRSGDAGDDEWLFGTLLVDENYQLFEDQTQGMPLDLCWIDEGRIADIEDLHMESWDREAADFV